MNDASPSPEVMPHETRNFAGRHPLALRFTPRSCLSARNWRAAEAALHQPALARFGVDDTKGRRRSGDRAKTKNPVRSLLSGRGGGEKDDKFGVANVLAATYVLRASHSSRAIMNLGSRRNSERPNTTSRRRSGGEPS
jgi:hypothetical protein